MTISLRNTGSEPLSIVFVFSKPGFEELMRDNSVLEGQPVPPMSAWLPVLEPEDVLHDGVGHGTDAGGIQPPFVHVLQRPHQLYAGLDQHRFENGVPEWRVGPCANGVKTLSQCYREQLLAR